MKHLKGRGEQHLLYGSHGCLVYEEENCAVWRRDGGKNVGNSCHGYREKMASLPSEEHSLGFEKIKVGRSYKPDQLR